MHVIEHEPTSQVRFWELSKLVSDAMAAHVYSVEPSWYTSSKSDEYFDLSHVIQSALGSHIYHETVSSPDRIIDKWYQL